MGRQSNPVQGNYGTEQAIARNSGLPIFAPRNPGIDDVGDFQGQNWFNTKTADMFYYGGSPGGSALWLAVGGGDTAVGTLSGDTGVAIPVSGNILLQGTAAQITTAASGNTVNFHFPNTMVIPGTLEVVLQTTLDNGVTVNGGPAIINQSATISTHGNALNLGTDNDHATINIGLGNAQRSINVGTSADMLITIGSEIGASSLSLYAGSAGLRFHSPFGNIQLDPFNNTGAITVITANVPLSKQIFTGGTINAGSTTFLIFNNSYVTTTTPLFVTISNLNTSGNGAYLGIQGIIQSNGSFSVYMKNNGAGNLVPGDDVIISFWVFA